MKDSLNRRLRFAAPQPLLKRIELTERDYLIFEAINRHGPLPSHYLYSLTKHVKGGKSFKHLQYRLADLFNGDKETTYLTKPAQQFQTRAAHYQHNVYDLAPKAKIALAERGTLSPHTPKRTDPFVHQLMGACIGASIEIAAREKGLRFISRHEVLTHKNIGAAKDAENPMTVPLSFATGYKHLIPDDLFGLEYPGQGFRFFAVEIDRNTESIERKSIDHNSFGRKIVGYLDILKRQTFHSYWGLPNLSVLTVTTNKTHLANILDFVRKQPETKFLSRFAFQYDPTFGDNWRVPRELMTWLMDEPWTTTEGVKRISVP